MEGETVVYLGRVVPVAGFRTYIYSFDEKKLVESWAEYQDHLASGLWFSTQSDADKANLEIVAATAIPAANMDIPETDDSSVNHEVVSDAPKAKRGKK